MLHFLVDPHVWKQIADFRGKIPDLVSCLTAKENRFSPENTKSKQDAFSAVVQSGEFCLRASTYVHAYDVKTDTKRARELALDTTIPCAGGICNVFRSVSFVEAVDAGTF